MSVKDAPAALRALARAEEALREARSGLEQGEVRVVESGSAVTLQELVDRSGISEDALAAFVTTLTEVLGKHALSVPVARRAALLAAAGQAWESEIGPLLTSAHVRELLGDVSRQRVDELLRAQRLIGLRDSAGRRRFPAFQFDQGRPLEPLVSAFWTVAEGAVDGWTAASWCVSADQALEGLTPAQWVRDGRDPTRLGRVAEQDAARLAR